MYLSCPSDSYLHDPSICFQQVSVPCFLLTDVHGTIFFKSSFSVIFHPVKLSGLTAFPVSQYTRFDHHSTSVFAININHHFGVQFLVNTIYLYCHPLPFAHNPLTTEFNGSCGTQFIHAASNCDFISIISNQPVAALSVKLVFFGIPGHAHLSHCDTTIADCI
jgi:hypothetical protein